MITYNSKLTPPPKKKTRKHIYPKRWFFISHGTKFVIPGLCGFLLISWNAISSRIVLISSITHWFFFVGVSVSTFFIHLLSISQRGPSKHCVSSFKKWSWSTSIMSSAFPSQSWAIEPDVIRIFGPFSTPRRSYK